MGLFSGFTYFQLQAEIITDPLNLGYSGFVAQNLWDSVSSLMDTPFVGSNFTLWRSNIKVNEVVDSIQPSDFANMTQNQVNRLQLLFQGAPINATFAGVRQNFSNVFSGSATLNSGFLTKLAQYQATRSEVLFGNGYQVTGAQVQRAMSNASGTPASGQ